MKYEIVIRNVETGEEKTQHECGEYAIVAMTDEGEPSLAEFESTVEHVANGVAMQAPFRAAARIAVAKYEAAVEIKRFAERQKSEKLADIFAGALNED